MKTTINLEVDDEMEIVKKSLKEYYQDVDDSADPFIVAALDRVLKHYMLKDEFTKWREERMDAR